MPLPLILITPTLVADSTYLPILGHLRVIIVMHANQLLSNHRKVVVATGTQFYKKVIGSYPGSYITTSGGKGGGEEKE